MCRERMPFKSRDNLPGAAFALQLMELASERICATSARKTHAHIRVPQSYHIFLPFQGFFLR
jgi:hypothetical protein